MEGEEKKNCAKMLESNRPTSELEAKKEGGNPWRNQNTKDTSLNDDSVEKSQRSSRGESSSGTTSRPTTTITYGGDKRKACEDVDHEVQSKFSRFVDLSDPDADSDINYLFRDKGKKIRWVKLKPTDMERPTHSSRLDALELPPVSSSSSTSNNSTSRLSWNHCTDNLSTFLPSTSFNNPVRSLGSGLVIAPLSSLNKSQNASKPSKSNPPSNHNKPSTSNEVTRSEGLNVSENGTYDDETIENDEDNVLEDEDYQERLNQSTRQGFSYKPGSSNSKDNKDLKQAINTAIELFGANLVDKVKFPDGFFVDVKIEGNKTRTKVNKLTVGRSLQGLSDIQVATYLRKRMEKKDMPNGDRQKASLVKKLKDFIQELKEVEEDFG